MSSARAIRRAAERLAVKAARPSAVSEAQLAANRENAQLSTGPRTAEGKAISSFNAVKSGLTGRTVVLPSDDAAEYQLHVDAHEREFSPVGYFECLLVQSIADTAWRLQRIAALEHALFCTGRQEFAEHFAAVDPAQRAAFIDLHTQQVHEKTLRNLHLQESRLARRREKDLAELRARQQARQAREEEEAAQQTAAAPAPELAPTPQPAANGFEFSNPPTAPVEPSAPAAEDPETAMRTAA